MKFIFAEFNPDYSKYNFPYQVFAKKEQGDLYEDIFQQGLLPTRINRDLFYLTRSSRVRVDDFEPSSENRRIRRKTEQFDVKLVPVKEFAYSPEIQKNCKDWFNERLGEKVIGALGVKKVFYEMNNNYVFVWSDGDKEIGYVVCLITEGLIHYNFAFYNPEYFNQNLGVRMMLEAVEYAKENNISYIYLGSVYEQSSMYKTQYKGFEFFNGIAWSSNLEELKYLINRPVDNPDYLWRDESYLKKFTNWDDINSLFEEI